jgi:hypothetical protein
MSTTVLSQRHFASVARSIGYHAMQDRSSRSSCQLAADLCRALEVNPFADDDEPKFAAAALVFDLQRINVAASNRRNHQTATVAFDGACEGLLLGLPALLKAGGCIRHNSDSGESRGALEKLDLILQILTAHIVHELPQYKKSAWYIE